MESVSTQDSQALVPQLAEVRAKLDGLVKDWTEVFQDDGKM